MDIWVLIYHSHFICNTSFSPTCNYNYNLISSWVATKIFVYYKIRIDMFKLCKYILLMKSWWTIDWRVEHWYKPWYDKWKPVRGEGWGITFPKIHSANCQNLYLKLFYPLFSFSRNQLMKGVGSWVANHTEWKRYGLMVE
jgi:hypothetical protein